MQTVLFLVLFAFNYNLHAVYCYIFFILEKAPAFLSLIFGPKTIIIQYFDLKISKY